MGESPPWRSFKKHVDVTLSNTVQLWIWKCWFTFGLDDHKGIFQPKQFHDSTDFTPFLSDLTEKKKKVKQNEEVLKEESYGSF